MVLTDGLTDYFKLDESSGTVLNEVGTITGTVNGAVAASTGIINTGYYFDGSNDNISLTTTLIATGDVWSISMWVYPVSGYTSTRNGLYSDGSARFLVELGTDGKIYTAYYTSINQNGPTSTNTVTQDTWNHVLWTRNGTENYLYVNGVQTYVSSGAGNISVFSGNAYFGSFAYTTNRVLKGNLDEIGFWTRELSAAEAAELYNSGAGLAYPFGAGPTPTIHNALSFGVNF